MAWRRWRGPGWRSSRPPSTSGRRRTHRPALRSLSDCDGGGEFGSAGHGAAGRVDVEKHRLDVVAPAASRRAAPISSEPVAPKSTRAKRSGLRRIGPSMATTPMPSSTVSSGLSDCRDCGSESATINERPDGQRPWSAGLRAGSATHGCCRSGFTPRSAVSTRVLHR